MKNFPPFAMLGHRMPIVHWLGMSVAIVFLVILPLVVVSQTPPVVPPATGGSVTVTITSGPSPNSACPDATVTTRLSATRNDPQIHKECAITAKSCTWTIEEIKQSTASNNPSEGVDVTDTYRGTKVTLNPMSGSDLARDLVATQLPPGYWWVKVKVVANWTIEKEAGCGDCDCGGSPNSPPAYVTVPFTIVGVKSITATDGGTSGGGGSSSSSSGPVTDDDPGVETPVKTLYVCKATSGTVDISAVPTPSVSESDLPSTWEITKVSGTLDFASPPGKLTATVSKAVGGDITVQVKDCPSSTEHFQVRIVVISLDSVTVASTACSSNKVTVTSPGSGTLYVCQGSSNSTTVNVAVTTTPNTSEAHERVLYSIGGNTTAVGPWPDNNFAPGNRDVTLTVASGNRTFEIQVGCDDNGNHILDGNEATVTVTVILVQIQSLTVTEVGSSPSRSVTNPSDTTLYVCVDPATGTVQVKIDAVVLPNTAAAKAYALWKVSATAPLTGNFASGATTITFTPSGGSGQSTIEAGCDCDHDGTLGASEVTHTITVNIIGVTLTVEDAGGAAGPALLIECMEGRWVTFTATVPSSFPGSALDEVVFHFQHADGTNWTASDYFLSTSVSHTVVADSVLSGDADHKFTTPIYVTIGNSSCGCTCKSNTLNIDVYELWIDYFKDNNTGKPWKVCIADPIAYGAIASVDCTSWDWDMEDGEFDAWNPTGGNAMSGTGMVIPNTDKARASNDWFGDAYGTVNVFCEDGEGNNHRFYSTSMSPSNKAQVFFEPDTDVDGNTVIVSSAPDYPLTAKPPAWFVFWKDGDVVEGMSTCSYKHRLRNYGSANGTSVTLGKLAPTTNSGLETLRNPITNVSFQMTGSGAYLACIAETLAHENYHNYIANNYNGPPQSDTDGINDTEETTPSEAYFQVSSPTLADTFNYPYTNSAGVTISDNEVRCRIRELQPSAVPASHPERNWARDTRNPKW